MSAGESLESAAEWFVVGPNQKPFGPYTVAKLREYIADGRLTRKTLVFRRGTEAWVPAESIPRLFAESPNVSGAPGAVVPAPPGGGASRSAAPACTTCRSGFLRRDRLYRMTTPVVIIGYILLVPSVIGILLCIGVFIVPAILGFVSSGAAAASGNNQAPAVVGVASGLLAISGACAIVGCFVSGLLGWLLVMKKTVLRCSACGMTVDAS